jgi:hypothetical protein
MSALGTKRTWKWSLQHLRQSRAPRRAWIVHVARNLLRALGCKFIEPIDDLGIAATLLNETIEPVTTITPHFSQLTRSLNMIAPSRGIAIIIAQQAASETANA